jgi:hypothetical protein
LNYAAKIRLFFEITKKELKKNTVTDKNAGRGTILTLIFGPRRPALTRNFGGRFRRGEGLEGRCKKVAKSL